MAEFVFEPPLPGGWDNTRTGFAAANHEAGHAVVGWFYGRRVLEVRVDRPDDSLGHCRFDAGMPSDATFDDVRAHLRTTIAGPVAQGAPLAWPPRRIDGDEGRAASFASLLDLDEAGWHHEHRIVQSSLWLLRRQLRALSQALLDHGALDTAHVKQVLAAPEHARSA